MIALIGTHGVGKTTLLEALSKIKPDLIVTDGTSRVVRNFNEEIGGKLSDRDQQLLINRISDSQWDNQIKTDNLFTTRTPLDHYAYSSALHMYDYAGERKSLFVDSDYNKVKFFYIPIEFELEDDGVRYTDKEFQKQIDKILVSLIEELDISVIKLTGSVDDRLETLLKNI